MSLDSTDVQCVAKEVWKRWRTQRWEARRDEEGRQVIVGAEQVTWTRRSWRRDDEVNVDVHVDWAGQLAREV